MWASPKWTDSTGLYFKYAHTPFALSIYCYNISITIVLCGCFGVIWRLRVHAHETRRLLFHILNAKRWRIRENTREPNINYNAKITQNIIVKPLSIKITYRFSCAFKCGESNAQRHRDRRPKTMNGWIANVYKSYIFIMMTYVSCFILDSSHFSSFVVFMFQREL